MPSSISESLSNNTLIITETKLSIYNALRETSLHSSTGVVSLNYFVNSTLPPLSNLSIPLLITLPLRTSSKSVQKLNQAVFSSSASTTKQRVIENKEIQCLFYNETTLSLSEEGCLVSDFSQTSVTCKCNHTTDFMAFV